MTEVKMSELYEEIKKDSRFDEDSAELYAELLEKSITYIGFRVRWGMMSIEEKMERDDSRTACHNSVITHFNMLSRYLTSQGVEHEWREAIGDDRRDIGDFSNYIVFREAVVNR